jgi:tetratricopeptide (TPR) repeat protein
VKGSRATGAWRGLVAAAACLLPSVGAAATQTQPSPRPARPAARAVPARSFDELARKAEEAKQAGRFDEAIQAYRQALKIKPSWLEGRFILGTLLYDNDHFEQARDEFRTLAQAEPKNGLVLALKGLSEFQLKSYERALKELQAARGLGIPSPEVLSAASYDVAILLNRFEQFEAAIDILRDFALQQKDSQGVIEAFGLSVLRMPYLPSEAPADRREMILMAGRAGFHQAKGRSSAYARQAYEELVSRYPTAPNVHYAYGVYLVPEQPEAALEEFRRELRASPNHVHAMLQIAYELIKQGKFEEAKPHAEKARELAPNLFAAHYALGRVFLEMGELDQAIQSFETGVKLAPDSPEVRFSLARAYSRAGRAEDAARERAEFVRLDKLRRTSRSGAQSVGGKDEEPPEPPPPPR